MFHWPKCAEASLTYCSSAETVYPDDNGSSEQFFVGIETFVMSIAWILKSSLSTQLLISEGLRLKKIENILIILIIGGWQSELSSIIILTRLYTLMYVGFICNLTASQSHTLWLKLCVILFLRLVPVQGNIGIRRRGAIPDWKAHSCRQIFVDDGRGKKHS